MQIPTKDIEDAINAIPAFFTRRIQTVSEKQEFKRLQNQSVDQLDGIAFLFIGNRPITLKITKAKLDIINKTYRPAYAHGLDHSIDCHDEHCLCEFNLYTNSGDACRFPVQSPDAVGQGSTNKHPSIFTE